MRHLSKRVIARVLWLSACLALCFPVGLRAEPADDLAKQLQFLTSMQAQFDQITLDDNGELSNSSRGNLKLKSGGFFRIETTEPFAQLLIANGEDFYTYDVDLEQVIVKPLILDVKQIPILLFGNNDQSFLQGYHITKVDEKRHTQYILEPQTPDGIFELLVIKFIGSSPSVMMMQDSLGQTTEIKLSSVQANIPLDDAQFSFTAPDGVDLIDDR